MVLRDKNRVYVYTVHMYTVMHCYYILCPTLPFSTLLHLSVVYNVYTVYIDPSLVSQMYFS